MLIPQYRANRAYTRGYVQTYMHVRMQYTIAAVLRMYHIRSHRVMQQPLATLYKPSLIFPARHPSDTYHYYMQRGISHRSGPHIQTSDKTNKPILLFLLILNLIQIHIFYRNNTVNLYMIYDNFYRYIEIIHHRV